MVCQKSGKEHVLAILRRNPLLSASRRSRKKETQGSVICGGRKNERTKRLGTETSEKVLVRITRIQRATGLA